MTALDTYLATRPDRCAHGYAPNQGCTDCDGGSEWSAFVAALKAAVGSDGLIHQTDMRPLIQRIPHKHRGSLYRQARLAGLIDLVGKEPSTDAAGRNTDKDQKVYRLARSAA